MHKSTRQCTWSARVYHLNLTLAVLSASYVTGCTGEPNSPRIELYPNADYRSLLSVSGPNAPDEVLFQWPSDTNPRVIGNSQLNEIALEQLRLSADVFDCEPYRVDDALKTAIQGAEHLLWLRMGSKAKADDLRWIATLSRLRGLSLCGADLSNADLGLLKELTCLQWLDLSEAILPAAANDQFPPLPYLEVLYLADAQVTDDQFPVKNPSPRLKSLCARGSLITDEGLSSLVDAYPNLQYLHLSRSRNITRHSLPALLRLGQLRYLHIGQTPLDESLSTNDLREFRKLLPECEIAVGD